MAPRKTHNGASAATRRTPTRGGVRASSASRTSTSPKPRPAARPKARTSSAKKSKRRSADPGRWWTLPAAVVVVLVVFAWSYYPVVRVQYRETREQARLAAELKGLQERNERLRDSVDRLRTPEGVEDYARSQLGLVKKGEHRVVVVTDGKAQASSAPANTLRIDSDETTATPIGPWTAFLDLVFGVE